MFYRSQRTPENMEATIITEQSSTGITLDAAALQRNDDFVAMALEQIKAFRLAASMPDADKMIEVFNEVANMTPEEEQAMNDEILRGMK